MSRTTTNGCALVTGGAGGVGQAVAKRLLEAGYDVAIAGRDRTALERAAHDLPRGDRRVVAVAFDVADRAAVEAGVREARSSLGPVRVVVNAAGIAASAPLLPPDDALFDRTMATNVRGAWVVTTACLPDMVQDRRGAVVNVASTAGLRAFRYVAAYVASKHALVGLTRAMAEDLRSKQITVNAVCPGFLDTPMTERTVAKIMATTGRTREQAVADVLATDNQARLIHPDEVAEAVLDLLGDPTVTGTTVEL